MRLDELLGRASKLTDAQAKEAATLLLSFYTEKQEKTNVADCLMKFKSTVCLFFFEAAITTLDPETQIQSLHLAICSTEAYKKNANHAATSRGFIITAVLIKNGVNIARSVLMQTLADVEKDGKFSDAVINNFKQNVVDYCGSLDHIKMLGDKDWDKPDSRRRFMRFMEEVNNSIVTVISPPESKKDVIISTTTTSPLPISPTPHNEQQIIPVSESNVAKGIADELLKTLINASKEAALLFQSLSDSNGTIALLRKDVASRDARIEEFSKTIRKNNEIIDDLHRKLDESKKVIRDNEAHIDDLSGRLKNSLQMDNISQNQELITLRTNLQNSLKIEYADYLVSKDSECNPDTYGALIGSLSRIFKTLRRFGIIID